MQPLALLYRRIVLQHPGLIVALIALLSLFALFEARHFRLDASADSLVLEHDQDLAYFRVINERYGSNDFLVITYTPYADLLSDESLTGIRALEQSLSKLERVESVITLLDVPLLDSPRVSLSQISSEVRTLETPDVDKELAREEFITSPLYSKMLVSPNGKTTVLQVNFKRDLEYFRLLEERDGLRRKQLEEGLSATEQLELVKAEQAFADYTLLAAERQKADIETVRTLMDTQRDKARLFLGGVPMITVDMIDFIQNDILIFGSAMILFIIGVLWLFFRAKRWIVLPLACCLVTNLLMLGWLGLTDWRATVISSNFISLLLIITLSICLHLTVRYRGLHADHPEWDQQTLVWQTIALMVKPCLYTVLTTMVAFSSLVVSGIRPVIDFGWMMSAGLLLGFVVCFLLFPALLMLTGPGPVESGNDLTRRMTLKLAALTERGRYLLILAGLLLALLCAMGVARLEVENRFIDYFKDTTEIYQGMLVIDQELGGTTPLDIVLDADQAFFDYLKAQQQLEQDPFGDEFADEFTDEFADDFADEGEGSDLSAPNYWFNGRKLALVEQIHDYLETLPEVGKVQSIATTMKVVRMLNNDQMPDDIQLAILRSMLPPDIKRALIDPFLSEDANQVRISMRVMETDPNLRRQELIEHLQNYLVNEQGLAPEQVHITGMLKLYNNMLQSLFESQILTIGTVFLAILGMFMVLFRSFYLAILTLLPNLLSAALVLGIMGWTGIPLDMMTITIAAIVVGIAVDDSIHYVHRFCEEFAADGDYLATMHRCHGSIGKAMYYTSVAIIVGFSIFALSNFTPSIVFGLLTGLAMLVAMLCNLTLLPALLLVARPLPQPQPADDPA